MVTLFFMFVDTLLYCQRSLTEPVKLLFASMSCYIQEQLQHMT